MATAGVATNKARTKKRAPVGTDEWLLEQCANFERLIEADGMPFNVNCMLRCAESCYRSGILKGDDLIQWLAITSTLTDDDIRTLPDGFTFEEALARRAQTVRDLFVMLGAVGTERVFGLLYAASEKKVRQ